MLLCLLEKSVGQPWGPRASCLWPATGAVFGDSKPAAGRDGKLSPRGACFPETSAHFPLLAWPLEGEMTWVLCLAVSDETQEASLLHD